MAITLATGEAHSVREFAELAFAHVGLDWQAYVEVDPRYYRPSEVDVLLGDASRARQVLDGSRSLADFDASLRTPDHRLNPGTTADLVAAILLAALLSGVRLP